MADLAGRNRNFFALLQELTDSDSETPQEPAKKTEVKVTKQAQPKSSQPKAVQPKQIKPKQTQHHSTQPLNPLPSLPQENEKKAERPKQDSGSAVVGKVNTQHDAKRRAAQGEERKDRSGKGNRGANKGGNSKFNWGKPGSEEVIAEVHTEEGKTEEVPTDKPSGEADAQVVAEPKQPEVESITLSEFLGKKLSWNADPAKQQYKVAMKTQHSDLLAFQVKSEPEHEFVRKERKPNRPPRKGQADTRTDQRPRRKEPRPQQADQAAKQ